MCMCTQNLENMLSIEMSDKKYKKAFRAFLSKYCIALQNADSAAPAIVDLPDSFKAARTRPDKPTHVADVLDLFGAHS